MRNKKEGWNRRIVVIFRWYLGFVYLFLIIFFVCICGFLCYLIYFDFFFFDRYNLVFIFIIYILRKIKWLVVGVLKKINKINFML